jgi:hypothetical protein
VRFASKKQSPVKVADDDEHTISFLCNPNHTNSTWLSAGEAETGMAENWKAGYRPIE